MPYIDVPHKEDRSTLNRIGHMVKALCMMALSIYVLIVLFEALAEVSRKELLLADTIPDDRCVPFFDKVSKWQQDNEDTTRALYDYRAGEAIIRICSALNESVVDEAVGKSKRYDPWKYDGKCDVLNNAGDRALFLKRCLVGAGNQAAIGKQRDPRPNCGLYLGLTANTTPWHLHWNHYLIDRSGDNYTFANGSTRTLRGKCWVEVSKINQIPNCTSKTVGPYLEEELNVIIVMQVAVAVPFIVYFFQGIAIWKYMDDGATGEGGWMLAFAERGILGAPFEVWWRLCRRNNDGDVKFMVGDFPVVYLNFGGWLLCAIQDMFEGIITPAIAIYGCNPDRFQLALALLICKCLKFTFDFVMTIVGCSKENEPGEFNEQAEFHRRLNAEEAAKNTSPVHTSTTSV